MATLTSLLRVLSFETLCLKNVWNSNIIYGQLNFLNFHKCVISGFDIHRNMLEGVFKV